MSKKLNQPIADINEAWVMAEAEKPYQERIVAAHQIAKLALYEVLGSGVNTKIRKARMAKQLGISKIDRLSYWLLEDDISLKSLGSYAVINTMNYIYYGKARTMSALDISSGAQAFASWVEEYAQKDAKIASKTYRRAQDQLTKLSEQN